VTGTSTTLAPPPTTATRARRRASALVRRHPAPNWFNSVMGTGVVANAAALLPAQGSLPRTFATVVWLLAAAWLAVLLALTAAHWARDGMHLRERALDPHMAPFLGSLPMALTTVGAGALLAGRGAIGLDAALALDLTLSAIGALTGLAVAICVPALMFARHGFRPGAASATWLLAVVPPLVSAASGAALVPHLPQGQPRLALLLACWGLAGLSLAAAAVVIALLCARLVRRGPGPARSVPALWIVLGPLGTSITAAILLGDAAPAAIAQPYARALRALGVLYGVPLWGLAMLWLGIAATILVRTARREGVPPSLAWWSFTFPVGTCVTGTSLLGARTGAVVLEVAALALFALLLVGWAAALTATAAVSFGIPKFQLGTPERMCHPSPHALLAKAVPAGRHAHGGGRRAAGREGDRGRTEHAAPAPRRPRGA
jgi:tellurite resistance protein TehA-like permease